MHATLDASGTTAYTCGRCELQTSCMPAGCIAGLDARSPSRYVQELRNVRALRPALCHLAQNVSEQWAWSGCTRGLAGAPISTILEVLDYRPQLWDFWRTNIYFMGAHPQYVQDDITGVQIWFWAMPPQSSVRVRLCQYGSGIWVLKNCGGMAQGPSGPPDALSSGYHTSH
jgi:hypothetical protein